MYVEPVSILVSVIAGGAVAIFTNKVRTSGDIREKKSERLISAYAEFFVQFQLALKYNEMYWTGMRWQIEGQGTYSESDKNRSRREIAEQCLLEAAWRLKIFERNHDLQNKIDLLAQAFSEDIEDASHHEQVALSYSESAARWRADSNSLLLRMQGQYKKMIY